MKPILKLRDFLIVAVMLIAGILSSCSGKKISHSVLLLDKEWFIQSSEKAGMTGEELSGSPGVPDGWFPAEVPSTVFGSLVKNGVYGDVFFGKNMDNVDAADFQGSWVVQEKFQTGKR